MNQYKKILGKVMMTAEDVWDINKKYEPISLVTDEETNKSYISRKDVPVGIQINNREYWQPVASSGIIDNGVIILNRKNKDGQVPIYDLKSAAESVAIGDRRAGVILGFLGFNAETDTVPSWKLYQYNDVSPSNWTNIQYWLPMDYTNKYAGWYDDAQSLYASYPFPKVGMYAYVGNSASSAVVYRCYEDRLWTPTEDKAFTGVVNLADEEDITSKQNKLKFKDKEYNPAQYNGMGRIYLRKNMIDGKNVLTQKMIEATNTIYIIQYDYDLQGDEITIPEGCTLDFQGGSFSNGTIKGNNTAILSGNTNIFRLDLSLQGSWNITSFQAKWFGMSVKNEDNSQNVNNILQSCYNTNVHKVIFSSGIFVINGEVFIGGAERNNWGIIIEGAGSNEGTGTTFRMGESGRFIIDQTNFNYGALRAGGIYHCSFISTSKTGSAILMKYSQCYTISSCHFSGLNKAIVVTGSTYFTNILSCTFESNNYGVFVPSAGDEEFVEGGANNNKLDLCWMTYCTNPILLSGTEGWSINNSDFEGGNGTIRLASGNNMYNCRIERNIDSKPYMEIGSSCVIQARIYATGGSPVERVIVHGDYNNISLQFNGYNPKALISYGKGNKFVIYCNTEQYYNEAAPIFIFDPEDDFIINGYSNKDNTVYSENLIRGINGEYDSSNIVSTLNGTKACKVTTNVAVGCSALTSINELYLTCNIYVADDSKDKDSYISFRTHNVIWTILNKKKWYTLVECNKTDSGTFNFSDAVLYYYDSNLKAAIINMCIATKAIYNRAPTYYPDGNSTHNIDNDGIVHINKFLNRTLLPTPFGTKAYTAPYKNICKNKIGKLIVSPTINTYIDCDGYNSVYGCFENNLAGVLQNRLSAVVEIFDLDNKMVYCKYYATRNSVNDFFVFKPVITNNITITVGNNVGTIAVDKQPANFVVWVVELKAGTTWYNSSSSKNIVWNGTKWVDATGTEV